MKLLVLSVLFVSPTLPYRVDHVIQLFSVIPWVSPRPTPYLVKKKKTVRHSLMEKNKKYPAVLYNQLSLPCGDTI